MNEYKLLFFAIGTLGFFAAVYLSIKHPELVKPPQEAIEEMPAGAEVGVDEPTDWRKWDKIATWTMWAGWGVAALIALIDRSGYLEVLEL